MLTRDPVLCFACAPACPARGGPQNLGSGLIPLASAQGHEGNGEQRERFGGHKAAALPPRLPSALGHRRAPPDPPRRLRGVRGEFPGFLPSSGAPSEGSGGLSAFANASRSAPPSPKSSTFVLVFSALRVRHLLGVLGVCRLLQTPHNPPGCLVLSSRAPSPHGAKNLLSCRLV